MVDLNLQIIFSTLYVHYLPVIVPTSFSYNLCIRDLSEDNSFSVTSIFIILNGGWFTHNETILCVSFVPPKHFGKM
jgi:hypothetical protein